jgi:AcrR family transcriptional regulator
LRVAGEGTDDVRERRTQERGVATRAALLDAAVECLVEQGYGATTTVEVAKRAGISRGAQLHHFPTKAELLTAAVYHLCERRTAEFRKGFAQAEPGADRLDVAIDLLWSMIRGPTFVAWVELWVAARTDPDLRRQVLEMDSKFMDESRGVFLELFPREEGVDPGFYEVGQAFASTLMDGLALQRMVVGDELHQQQMIDALKAISRLFVPRPPDTAGPGDRREHTAGPGDRRGNEEAP